LIIVVEIINGRESFAGPDFSHYLFI
jgi:hypothetical protein